MARCIVEGGHQQAPKETASRPCPCSHAARACKGGRSRSSYACGAGAAPAAARRCRLRRRVRRSGCRRMHHCGRAAAGDRLRGWLGGGGQGEAAEQIVIVTAKIKHRSWGCSRRRRRLLSRRRRRPLHSRCRRRRLRLLLLLLLCLGKHTVGGKLQLPLQFLHLAGQGHGGGRQHHQPATTAKHRCKAATSTHSQHGKDLTQPLTCARQRRHHP